MPGRVGEGKGGDESGGEGRRWEGRGGQRREGEKGREMQGEKEGEEGDKFTIPGALKSFYQHVATTTHHCENGSWFLDPQCFHHLEYVHHSLRLAALDGGGNGTEHTRAANCITVQ